MQTHYFLRWHGMVVAFETDRGMGAGPGATQGLEFQGSDTHTAEASFVGPSRSLSDDSSSLLLEQQLT